MSEGEWHDLLEPTGRRTLRTLCEAISREAQIEDLPERGLLGCPSSDGRVFRSLRAALLHLGMPGKEISTRTPVEALLARYGFTFGIAL